MPVKILLADKSITIQKVVEMLFSGREYEVVCVSDGETALNEAQRVTPDVVLVDVGLPRLDGYTLSTRLKQVPSLAQTPVILMMSRDDVFDAAKGKQAGIIDSIAKPFESQDLIGKVKKALASAPPRLGEPAAAPRPAAAPTAPAPPRPAAPAAPAAEKPKKAEAADIFDIIQEAPSPAELKKPAAPVEEESVYEVEPEVEEIEPLARETAKVLPIGTKAVDEMRAGLGLTEKKAEPEIVPFESFDLAQEAAKKPVFPPRPAPAAPPRREEKPTPPTTPVWEEGREYVPPTAGPAPTAVSPEMLRAITEETVARMAQEMFKNLPPPPMPKITDDTVRRGLEEVLSKIAREMARDVIEKVAWEVIPPLAEHLIQKEIERLKALE